MLDPVSPLPAIACLLSALVTAYLLALKFGVPSSTGRFASIDGLRGYLAFGVFLHHAATWYFFARTGSWASPPSHLYTHLGHSGVALFFMITGFLFFTKLLNSRQQRIDWTKLFIGRIMRLAPLYFFSMALLFAIVAVLSDGALNVPITTLLADGVQWLLFTMFETPNLNGIANTKLIIAGVTWSLPYEWLFYLSLPLMALAVGHTAPLRFLALGALGIAGFAWLHSGLAFILAFGGGIAAALLVRLETFRRQARSPLSTLVILGALSAAIYWFPHAHNAPTLLLLTIAFALIAGGNTLFGALTCDVSRLLGEIAYGLYLLHGLVLFVVFNFIVDTPHLAHLSPGEHWGAVLLATPPLIVMGYAAFRMIEAPAMRYAAPLAHWLRAKTTRIEIPLDSAAQGASGADKR